MKRGLIDETQVKFVYDTQGVKREVLISYEMFQAIMDLLEDREDELDMKLGKRITEERQAYSRGEGKSFEAFIAEDKE